MAINANITLKRLVYEIEQWAAAHKMLKKFGYGDFLEIFSETEREYPYLMLNIVNANEDQWYYKYQLEMCVMDWVWDNDENDLYVESDTSDILRDFSNTARYSPRWQTFAKVQAEDIHRKFIHKGGDGVTGWCMTMNLWIKKKSGFCDLELLLEGYDFEGSPPSPSSCAPGTFTINGNTVTFGSIASGTTIDVDVKDTGGAAVGSEVAGEWIVPEALPVNTDFNSTPTGVDTPAGQNLDINVVDAADGTTPIGTLTTNTANEKKIEVTLPAAISTSPLNTGQETQYRAGDDGARFIAGDYASVDFADISDFYTLVSANEWSHFKRFTGDTGGYMDEATGNFFDKDGNATTKALAFPNDIMRDYCTRRRWFLNRSGTRIWDDAIDLAQTDVRGGESGWRLPNRAEYDTLSSANGLTATYIDSRLHNWSAFNMWSSTTDKTNTAQAFRLSTATDNWTVAIKTQANGGAYVKLF